MTTDGKQQQNINQSSNPFITHSTKKKGYGKKKFKSRRTKVYFTEAPLGSMSIFIKLRSWIKLHGTALGITFEASTSFFNSSMSRFSFALLFWNHVITWALVSPSDWAISSRSAGDKYFWYRKRFSSSNIWWFVKAVLDFLFFLGCCRLLNIWRWSLEESVTGEREKEKKN